MGPGIPHDLNGAGRFAFCERPTRAATPRVVHAPERPDARVRVELQRCESARARLGVLARLQNLQSRGRPRYPIPGALFSKAAAELYLVGESQGRARTAYLLRRLPGTG